MAETELTERQKQVMEGIAYIKKFVDTYHKQSGYLDYTDQTIVDDVLYAIGVAVGGKKYQWAMGFNEFKKWLLKHLQETTFDIEEREVVLVINNDGVRDIEL